MNKIISIATIFATLTMFSCKRELNKKVTVVRDCTGTYLHFNGDDYHVCNLEKVSSFADGTTVTATFKRIKECNGTAMNDIICMMMHDNEGWIEVEKIK